MDDFLGLDLWTRTGTERAKSSKYDLSSIFGPGFFVRLVFATTGLSRLAEITESKIRAKMSPQMYKE